MECQRIVEQSPSVKQNSVVQLAIQLRKDNEQLRKMVTDAQECAEKAASRAKNMDFVHLLELVNEFSTELEGSAQQDGKDLENETIVDMNAEQFRLDADDEDERDLHLEKLKAKVAAAKS